MIYRWVLAFYAGFRKDQGAEATPLMRVHSPHPGQRWVFAQPVQPVVPRVLRAANRSSTSLHDVIEWGNPVRMPSWAAVLALKRPGRP